MVKDTLNGQTNLNTLVNGFKILSLALVLISKQMVDHMKDNGRKELFMGKVYINMVMEKYMMAIISVIKEKDGVYISGQMVQFMMVNGNKTKNMDMAD